MLSFFFFGEITVSASCSRRQRAKVLRQRAAGRATQGSFAGQLGPYRQGQGELNKEGGGATVGGGGWCEEDV